ncbi:MAG: hypothetical protein A2Y10_05625 [Planctomycetes bacterium GWF2_41_51]|nr:MAG: hypothetical protein A2Y10_05625 [Planctomycetes bacterium GWF2_41_51]
MLKKKLFMMVVGIVIAGYANASIIYTDDFTGTDGTSLTAYNSDWTIVGGKAQLENNVLNLGTQITGDDADNNVLFTPAGSNTWENYTVSVDILSTRNFATSSSSTLYTGIILYAAAETEQTDRLWGYQVRLLDKTGTSQARLYIGKRTDGGGAWDLGYINLPGWAVNTWFNLEASIATNSDHSVSISAAMRDINGNVIGEVFAVDDGSLGGRVLEANTFGFNSAMSYSAADYHTEFDNLEVTVIPEPATIGLLVMGSALLLRKKR